MTADQRSGRVLIASNRGPISFTMADDGSVLARRGAGGLVSGLSSVLGQASVLWVCAALSDADRTAARGAPDGLIEVTDGADGGPGRPSACWTSRPSRSSGRTTRWPTPRSGSCTTCSTTRRTSPASARRSAASGSRSAVTTPRSRRRWPRAPPPRSPPPYQSRRWCRTITCRWSRGCWLSSARTSGSRTSRTPRGRRRTTTGCCPARWAGKCWTACWLRTTPGSCASAGPTPSSRAAPSSSAPRWTGRRARSGTAGTSPRWACTRSGWTQPGCATGPRPPMCRHRSRR